MRLSHRTFRFSSVFAFAGTAALFAPACSSRQGFDTTPDTFSSQDASAQDADVCGPSCSPDLKTVLNKCNGAETVIENCGPDQGCGPGRCVDACEAAAFSKGSIGCEFWTLPADDGINLRGSCFAAMLANTWDRPVTIAAEYGTQALDISKSTYLVDINGKTATYTALDGKLAPGQVAILFLAQASDDDGVERADCPAGVTPALIADPIRHGTSKTTAFHLTADAPISAYSIYPYGGAPTAFPTATLLLPVSSWEKDYIAVSPHDFGPTGKRRTIQIVANEDNTTVRIRPNVEIPSGTDVAGTNTGVTQSWTLSRGQVLQFTQTDMTGSPISTTKPVGVFGGSECTDIPKLDYCDLLQQQIAPFSQWGTEYALVPFKPRFDNLPPDVREQVPYTLVGAANGTVLTYEPERPRDAPETLDAGQVVGFITDQLVVVNSQDSAHPFHAAVYMTGSTYGGGISDMTTLGDPDFVNIPPSDQFLNRYVFFSDYTFPETRLTIVRRKTANGFLPVEVECAGEITGFTPLGTSGNYEYAWVSLTSDFVPQPFGNGTCGYGRHEARSDGTFSVTVWGMGEDASYGYAGGMGLRPINNAPPPVVE